jgi:hypothetical protein
VLKSRFAAAGVVLALFIACSSSEEKQVSQRGEDCERHSDCDEGLACVGGVCTIGSFEIAATGKECVLIQCEQDSDCCDSSPECESYKAACNAGNTASCDLVLQYCACNAQCEDNRCKTNCDADSPCPLGTFCESGQCVECQCDAHCGTGSVCKNAICVTECLRDADCDDFQRCQENECVDVGCETERECVASLRSVLAFCNQNTKACQEHCSSDIECDNGENFNFRACIEGTCRDVGCNTDEECRAAFLNAGEINPKAACRERSAPPAPGVAGIGGAECPPVPCTDTCAYANDGYCDEAGLCAPGTDCTDCLCGNDRLDPGEECDGNTIGSATCASVTGDTLSTGTLYCYSDCTFDTSYCGTSGYCGDTIVSGTEECDTTNFNGETCSSYTGGVYPYGTLTCSGCYIYDYNCTSILSVCGNGVIESGEECEPSTYSGTCSSETGYATPFGTASCDPTYCTIDVSACTTRPCDTCAWANDGACDETSLCTAGTDCSDCCTDTCATALNGVCDEPSLCLYGTDCYDCGG